MGHHNQDPDFATAARAGLEATVDELLDSPQTPPSSPSTTTTTTSRTTSPKDPGKSPAPTPTRKKSPKLCASSSCKRVNAARHFGDCVACGGRHCSLHRLPEEHRCEGVKERAEEEKERLGRELMKGKKVKGVAIF